MGRNINRHFAIALTATGLALGATLVTAAMAPAYLASATTEQSRASRQAQEAAEHGLGKILRSERIDSFLELDVGHWTIVATSLPALGGDAHTTIIRQDSVTYSIHVVGSDSQGREQHDIHKTARVAPDGVIFVPGDPVPALLQE